MRWKGRICCVVSFLWLRGVWCDHIHSVWLLAGSSTGGGIHTMTTTVVLSTIPSCGRSTEHTGAFTTSCRWLLA